MVFLVLPLVVGLAFIPAYIAKKRGHSFGTFLVLGLFFFVPTLLATLSVGDLAAAQEENEGLRAQIRDLRKSIAGKEAAQAAEKDKAPDVFDPTCPQCGHANAKEKAFCSKCGTKLEIVPDSEAICRCRKCKAPLGEGDEFCGKCGANTVAEAAAAGRVTVVDGRMDCPKCGARQLPSRKTCYRCGLVFTHSEE